MISTNYLLIAVVFSLALTFVLNHIFTINQVLLDQVSTSKHKQLTSSKNSKKAILCGGIIIFICSTLFFDNEFFEIKIFAFLILIIGVLSDTNQLNSPKFRILCQLFIVLLLLIYNNDLIITDLRINFINDFLQVKFVSMLFTTFCILILINGSNFLDGINTLVVGYFILVLGIILLMSNQFDLYINENIFYFVIFLITVFIFNFFNKIYLGDSGSYLISFLTAFFILDFFSKNDFISPYFFCLILWYPAYENLFSIIRRISLKKKLDKPDQNHLHQMIYILFKRNKFLSKKYINTITGVSINSFNFIIFIFSYKYYLLTKPLVVIIFFNISIYLLLYFFIKKKLNHFD